MGRQRTGAVIFRGENLPRVPSLYPWVAPPPPFFGEPVWGPQQQRLATRPR